MGHSRCDRSTTEDDLAGKKLILTWQHDPAINAPASYKRACKYETFIPDTLTDIRGQLKLDDETTGMVSEAELAIRSLNEVAKPALNPLARLLLRTESIASSKVEGMQMGVRELAKAEARDDHGGNAGANATEILANIDAMQLAVDEATTIEIFSISQIEDVHRLLMHKAWNAHLAGNIRTQQNWIGGNDHNPCGADYVPPPPEHVHRLLADLCDTVNDQTMSPLVQAALVHAQFETIHPFDDGNGRTGRALIQIVLRRRGLAAAYVPPISVILARSKDRYIQGLTHFREEGGEQRWIKQFADSARNAAELARTYLGEIRALTVAWRAKLETLPKVPRADSVAWRIIDELPAHPVISVPIAEAATRVSRVQVGKAFADLEKAGVIKRISEGKKNRIWEADGLLDLIARLEAGQLPQTPDN